MSMVWEDPPATSGAVPSSRFGHTCTTVNPWSEPRLIVIGGHNSREALSDVYMFDVDKFLWSQPEIIGEAPLCGNRHAAVLLEEQNGISAILIFATDMHENFQTLYALKFAKTAEGLRLNWVPVQTNGPAPPSRARPSVVMMRELLLVLCGVTNGKPLNTVELLDTRTMTWIVPTVEGVPPMPRMGATATSVGSDVYLFGGSDGKVSLADLHVMVCVTWLMPAWTGVIPRPRVGHTFTAVGSRLMMLGGASEGVPRNDLYVLDPATQAWSKPPMYGHSPEALIGHSASLVGSELFVFGGGDGKLGRHGLFAIDTVNMLWSSPITAGSEPNARVGHSSAYEKSKLLIFGGYGQRQYWNELVVLDTGIMNWMRPHTSGKPPLPCVLHSATMVNGAMIICGGCLDEQPIDQLMELGIDTMKWSKIGDHTWRGDRPRARFGHGAASVGSRLFLFGGTTGVAENKLKAFVEQEVGYRSGARNDLVVIDLNHRHFSYPHYVGEKPPPSYRLSMQAVRGKLVIWGGVGSAEQAILLDTGLAGEASWEEQAAAAALRDAGLETVDREQEMERRRSEEEEGKGLPPGEAAALVGMLQDLGLNKYSRIFLRQEVDVDSLLEMGDQDLRDIGIHAVGARRRLSVAIHRERLKRNGPGDETDKQRTDDKLSAAVTSGYFRGRFRLTGRVYIGGSAIVKMAHNDRTGQDLAIKIHSQQANFSREEKLLRQLSRSYKSEADRAREEGRLVRTECIVQHLESFYGDDEERQYALVLEGGDCNLRELLLQGQLSALERKHVFERLCHILHFVHSRGFVALDFKPHNIVVFGSLHNLKLIDLECLRKASEPVPLKLTPFYAAPEMASAAIATMQAGGLPHLDPGRAEPSANTWSEPLEAGRWGANTEKIKLLAQNPTLARAVAIATQAANRGGDPSAEPLRADEAAMLNVPLKTAAGRQLRASPMMDIWALGMILYELFTNEPYFSGCSDDVVLQVLASHTPLELPLGRIEDEQAQHLLSKLLFKRPRERLPLEQILKHAYIEGGLDEEQVDVSFKKVHEVQQSFKEELNKLEQIASPWPEGAASSASAAASGKKGTTNQAALERARAGRAGARPAARGQGLQ